MDYTFLNQLSQMTLSDILKAITSTLVITYQSKKKIPKYHVHKEDSIKQIKEVILPQEVAPSYSSVDIDTLLSKKLGEHLVKFSEVMERTFKKEDLKLFYQNIHTLTTNPKKMTIKKRLFSVYTAAYYDSQQNSITIDVEEIENTLYHELLHMTSSLISIENNVEYCGFSQTLPNKSIGDGINEGYTELLTERYFTTDASLTESYSYEMDVSLNLEKIIGQKKMESLYLHADLLGLINELKKYATEDNIMKFIASSDYLYQHLDYGAQSSKKDNLINNCLKEVNQFLITTFSNKMSILSHQGLISVEEETKSIAKFIYSIKKEVKTPSKVYHVMNQKEVDEILDIIFISPTLLSMDKIKKSI